MKEKLKELQPALQFIEHNGQNNFAFFFLRKKDNFFSRAISFSEQNKAFPCYFLFVVRETKIHCYLFCVPFFTDVSTTANMVYFSQPVCVCVLQIPAASEKKHISWVIAFPYAYSYTAKHNNEQEKYFG